MERKGLSSALQQISRIAVLSALCVALRYVFAGLPNVQPITAIFLLISVIWGFRQSFWVMAVTMLVSSFLLGFGPWVLWQIMAFALIILVWRHLLYPLTEKLWFSQMLKLVLQSLFAGLMGALYGCIIDFCYALLYSMPWWTYVLAGLSFNLAHALSTVFFYPLLATSFRRLIYEKNQ
ncbi:ECF transporter S component [Streptococcus pantholopis]|uniref:ECF transporter S component n=1 Tax=Streptococcus pantholopis TaxID=1811193 RepID=A0A172Q6C0_9STRE|nr:ECF transporter S component [Streptococcus pantholopis]AND79006.1 hypothetical protein A0O21_02705 [Streptococcus pantholopis]